ncbi:TRAP transporter small permease [Roseovarius sp. MMSF_3281]|uniref:TRAP transporter small permease n=1 Tax=Roseovarius sp. MMSF_3281 TaxID=3046694 RepID=UPI00273FFFB0|nr:TRAP transporter small permease [Roseovarius sp. MMSF_3281]
MEKLERVCSRVEQVATAVGVGLFVTMIAVVFFEVVMRYLFSSPTFWSEALARAAMIWLVMLGLARGVRRMDNIRVDFLVDQMPRPLQHLCAWLRFAAVTVFALVMLVYGTQMALANWNTMNTGFEISMTWIYLAVPVSGALILLFTVELVAKGERGFF